MSTRPLNPLHVGGQTEAFVAAAHAYLGDGSKTAGAMLQDFRVLPSPIKVVADFQRACGVAESVTPSDLELRLDKFVGALNADGSRRFTKTGSQYSAAATS
jgi:hypothetical protein